mmetsp:Transcript_2716/g.6563  ORF Transcript_2716/g.6563 Transcript_2716/m.6563 type:complete len:493 (+) Transcript_2716:346-1824(+)
MAPRPAYTGGGAAALRRLVAATWLLHVPPGKVHRVVLCASKVFARAGGGNARLHAHAAAGQQVVHCGRHVVPDAQLALAGQLHKDGERGGARALQPALPERHALALGVQLGSGIADGDLAHVADEGAQIGVAQQGVQREAVHGGHHRHAALRNRASGGHLCPRANLINHQHLRIVVLHRLQQHLRLLRALHYRQPARVANAMVRRVAVARNLIGRIHHHNAALEHEGRQAHNVAQDGCLANARVSQEQQRLAQGALCRLPTDAAQLCHEVCDHLRDAFAIPPQPHRHADDAPRRANGRYAVERFGERQAAVLAEAAGGHVEQSRHGVTEEVVALSPQVCEELFRNGLVQETKGRRASAVHDDFHQPPRRALHRLIDHAHKPRWEDGSKEAVVFRTQRVVLTLGGALEFAGSCRFRVHRVHAVLHRVELRPPGGPKPQRVHLPHHAPSKMPMRTVLARSLCQALHTIAVDLICGHLDDLFVQVGKARDVGGSI